MPYSTDALANRTILVAEDDYLLAETIAAAIKSAGGSVQGPFASSAETLDHLARAQIAPDAAALNMRLLDGDSLPVADELARLLIPFAFASGNEPQALPPRFSRVPLVSKPYAAHQVVQTLVMLLNGSGDPDRQP